jgi:DNA-binding PadR family transcriptional regulator
VPIPEISHLQFLVLASLLEGELPGRSLREKLAEEGRRMSGPAFYQFMARLEEAAFADGRYVPKVIDGHTVKERVYSITGSGVHAVKEYRDFALSHGGVRLQGA